MQPKPKLKICGVSNVEDARLVSASGADYCGILVEVGFSERSLSPTRAREVANQSTIPVVLLMCDPTPELVESVVSDINPHAVQLLCKEPPEFVQAIKKRLPCHVWKSIHLPSVEGQSDPQAYARAGVDALLVDRVDTSEGQERMGGTGKTVDWESAAAIVQSAAIPVFLGGGIDAANIAEALLRVRPFGMDLCSGVEAQKGRKDPKKLAQLVTNFKRAASSIER